MPEIESATKTEDYLPKDAVISFSKLMENTSDNVQFTRKIILKIAEWCSRTTFYNL